MTPGEHVFFGKVTDLTLLTICKVSISTQRSNSKGPDLWRWHWTRRETAETALVWGRNWPEVVGSLFRTESYHPAQRRLRKKSQFKGIKCCEYPALIRPSPRVLSLHWLCFPILWSLLVTDCKSFCMCFIFQLEKVLLNRKSRRPWQPAQNQTPEVQSLHHMKLMWKV